LRRIHKQVQNLIFSEEAVKPEQGLYRVGEYYMKNKRYSQAIYAYQRYLTYYPSGSYAADVTQKIETAEDYLQKYGQGKGPTSNEAGSAQEISRPETSKELSDVAKAYYNGVSLVSQQKYDEAFKEFRKIVAAGEDPEYVARAQYEMGRCLYHMKQYDNCIKSFTVLIQKYPKHPDLPEALYFVGLCYHEKGETEKAEGFYNKILSLIREDNPLFRKVKKALRGN
jgi:TolA-binding protein